MRREDWRDFRQRYPRVAREILALGSTLYELGAEKARSAPELKRFVKLIGAVPSKVREGLGFEVPVNDTQVLRVIFESGSSLLLDFVRNGAC